MKFLSQEWFVAVGEALAGNAAVQTAAAGANFGVQQVVTGAPGGSEIRHYFKVDGGVFEIGLGDLPGADATMTASYADAAALNKGELDAMAAFGSGKMLVTGNMAVLMQNQAVLGQMNGAFEALREQTEYEG